MTKGKAVHLIVQLPEGRERLGCGFTLRQLHSPLWTHDPAEATCGLCLRHLRAMQRQIPGWTPAGLS